MENSSRTRTSLKWLLGYIIFIFLLFDCLVVNAHICIDPEMTNSQYWKANGKLSPLLVAKPSELREVPKELVADHRSIFLEYRALASLINMVADAEHAGVHLQISSGFRSETTQSNIIKAKLKSGMCPSDILKAIAPAGYSTHATGRAIDFSPATKTFAITKEYRWLKINSTKYGFIETYSNNKTKGIEWEPWHYDFTSH